MLSQKNGSLVWQENKNSNFQNCLPDLYNNPPPLSEQKWTISIENATSPWVQSWVWHFSLLHSCKTLSQDCPYVKVAFSNSDMYKKNV